MGSYLVIGPSGAGKTVLLASLQQACYARQRTNGQAGLRLYATTEGMRVLFDRANDIVDVGVTHIEATTSLTELEFELHVESRRFWGGNRRAAYNFSCLDGPGGDLFGDTRAGADSDVVARQQLRRPLLVRLAQSTGLLLCVDPSGETSAHEFFRALSRLLTDASVRPLPAKRIAICLTKADRFFASSASEARQCAEQADPQKTAYALLGRRGLEMLFAHCRDDVEVAVTWSSAFGFMRGHGEPNYNPETDALLISSRNYGSEKAVEHWEPFRVLEPFLFLANGGEYDCMRRLTRV